MIIKKEVNKKETKVDNVKEWTQRDRVDPFYEPK